MKYIFILKAVLHSISHRKFSVFTSIFAISAAFAFLAAIGCVSFGLAATAVNSSLAFPLVVGPAGASDTTLVMSTLFNTDKPAGTLDYEFAGKLASDERVSAVFPVARSDSYMGVPITGVESAYINEISRGFEAIESGLKEDDIFGGNGGNCAVIGSKTAARYEMKTGDTFFGSHGSVGDEDAHLHDFEYRVCAVLKAVNGPEDFSIFTSLRNVWKIHEHGHHHEQDEAEEHDLHHDHGEESAEGKITAVLKGCKSPSAKLKFAFQPFCFAEFSVIKNGKFYQIIDAKLIDSFFDLTTDLNTYYLSSLVLEVASLSVDFEEQNPSLFLLLVNSLKFMCYGKLPADLVALKFLIDVSNILGYRINYKKCLSCGMDYFGKIFLNLDNGEFVCDSCKTDSSIQLSNQAFSLLKILSSTEYDRLGTIKIASSVSKEATILLCKNLERRLLKIIHSAKFI